EARGAVGALHVPAHRLDELVVVADRRQRVVLVRLRPPPARRGLCRGRRYGDGERGERDGDRRGCAVLLHMAPLPRVDYSYRSSLYPQPPSARRPPTCTSAS